MRRFALSLPILLLLASCQSPTVEFSDEQCRFLKQRGANVWLVCRRFERAVHPTVETEADSDRGGGRGPPNPPSPPSPPDPPSPPNPGGGDTGGPSPEGARP